MHLSACICQIDIPIHFFQLSVWAFHHLSTALVSNHLWLESSLLTTERKFWGYFHFWLLTRPFLVFHSFCASASSHYRMTWLVQLKRYLSFKYLIVLVIKKFELWQRVVDAVLICSLNIILIKTYTANLTTGSLDNWRIWIWWICDIRYQICTVAKSVFASGNRFFEAEFS